MVLHKLNTKTTSSPVWLSLTTFGILLATTLLAGTITINTTVSAETTKVDTVNISISAACTMIRTDSSGGVYTTSLIPGQETELGPTSIKTICNDNNGYAIYAIGYSGDTYTGSTHTDLISTISNDYNIHTNTASSAGNNSYWAMKLAPVSSGSYTPTVESAYLDYNVVPSSFTKVVSLGQSTDAGDGAIGSNVNATYKVKAAASQVADTYTGKVKYVLVHPNTATPGTYTIAYNANGGSGTMESSTGIYTFDAFELPESTFTPPSGYAFAGWCTTQDTSQNPQTTCAGETYADEDVVEPSTVSANATLNLYALWQEGTKTMQDVSTWASTLSPGDEITATDNRDQKEYTVAKLADGNIWMTQNLAIAPGTHMTAADTNITSAQYNNDGYYALPGEGYDLRTDGTAASETSTGNCNSANDAGYINACTHLATQTDLDEIIAVDSSLNYSLEQVGAWYNYAAATAGSIAVASTTNEDVYNICPQGWTLPSNTQNNTLVTALDGNYSSFRPLYGGRYNNGSHNVPASSGNWWSTTAGIGTIRWNLRYNSGSLSAVNGYRYSGYYVRCIMVAS